MDIYEVLKVELYCVFQMGLYMDLKLGLVDFFTTHMKYSSVEILIVYLVEL